MRFFKILILLTGISGIVVGQSRPVEYVGGDPSAVMYDDSLAKELTGLSTYVNVVIPRILKAYEESGYLQARMDSVLIPEAEEEGVKVYLTPGQQLAGLQVTGMDDSLITDWEWRISGALSDPASLWKDRIRQRLSAYNRKGFPSARWQPVDVIVQNHNVVIRGRVEPGRQFRIDTMAVVHTGATGDHVFLRETRIPLNSLYDSGRIGVARQRLQQLPYVAEVKAAHLIYTVSGKQGILWEIRERRANRFSGLVGYVPQTGEQEGYFTGQLEFSLQNLFGTGRQLHIYWEKRDVISQEMALSYTEPWIAGWPLDLSGSFRQNVQDSSYIQRKYSIRGTYQINWSWRVYGEFGGGQVISTPFGRRQYGLQDYQSANLLAGLAYNSLDDPLNPRSGLHYAHEFIRKSRVPGVDGALELLDFSLQSVHSLVRDHVVSANVTIRNAVSPGDSLPVSELFRFGGAGSVRGYNESAYLGSTVAWTNLEYRLLFENRSRIFTFYDYGYWKQQDKGGGREGNVSSVGIGLRLATPVGQLGVDYGVPIGSTRRQGRLHLQLINYF